jgi:hypothetical protein
MMSHFLPFQRISSQVTGEARVTSAARPCALYASPLAFCAWICKAQEMEKQMEKEKNVEQFYTQLQKSLKGYNHKEKVKIASSLLNDEIREAVAQDLCHNKLKGNHREIEPVLMDAVFPHRDAYCNVCQSWGCWTDHK